jgi:hypothetical protein
LAGGVTLQKLNPAPRRPALNASSTLLRGWTKQQRYDISKKADMPASRIARGYTARRR